MTIRSGTLGRSGWLAVLLAVVVVVLGIACTSPATAAPLDIPTGHHAVHDLHCEPAAPADASSIHRAPTEPGDTPVTEPGRPEIGSSAEFGFQSHSPPVSVPAPGRALLLRLGVDRN